MKLFTGIQEFVCVARHSSFRIAAKELQVSAAHVSRSVKALESRLGVKLLSRDTRNVELTESGRAYFNQCLSIVDATQEANDSLTAGQNRLEGAIKIAAGGDFAELVITPIITEFAKRHPNLHIAINFNSSNENLVENNYDFAIRYGALNDSNIIARKLATRALRFACSESYLQEYGEPKHPRDLVRHRCLTSGTRPWTFVENGKNKSINANAVWQSNNARALVENALQGNGIVYLPTDTIAYYDNEKQLKSVLIDYALNDVPSWIVYPQREYIPARVRKLIEFILQRIEQK